MSNALSSKAIFAFSTRLACRMQYFLVDNNTADERGAFPMTRPALLDHHIVQVNTFSPAISFFTLRAAENNNLRQRLL